MKLTTILTAALIAANLLMTASAIFNSPSFDVAVAAKPKTKPKPKAEPYTPPNNGGPSGTRPTGRRTEVTPCHPRINKCGSRRTA